MDVVLAPRGVLIDRMGAYSMYRVRFKVNNHVRFEYDVLWTPGQTSWLLGSFPYKRWAYDEIRAHRRAYGA